MSRHKEIGTITAVGSPLSLETYWISASGIVYSLLRFNGRRLTELWALLFDGEFGPPGQRGRTVVEEHDAARFGERQIGRQRAVVDDELLQDLAIVRVAGVQPGALGEQPATPSHGDQAGALLAGGGQALLEFIQAAVEQPHAGLRGVLALQGEHTGRIDVGGLEDPGAAEGFWPAHALAHQIGRAHV